MAITKIKFKEQVADKRRQMRMGKEKKKEKEKEKERKNYERYEKEQEKEKEKDKWVLDKEIIVVCHFHFQLLSIELFVTKSCEYGQEG